MAGIGESRAEARRAVLASMRDGSSLRVWVVVCEIYNKTNL
jgi:hypothetical protein